MTKKFSIPDFRMPTPEERRASSEDGWSRCVPASTPAGPRPYKQFSFKTWVESLTLKKPPNLPQYSATGQTILE